MKQSILLIAALLFFQNIFAQSTYNLGVDTGSTECAGTLFDSGGESGDYLNNESHTFTVCPDSAFECLILNLSFGQMEVDFDYLEIFEGPDDTGKSIAQYSEIGLLTDFVIATDEPCVTVYFKSDNTTVAEGFELNWSCSDQKCAGSSLDDPIELQSLTSPIIGNSCDDYSSLSSDICDALPSSFLGGPEVVYSYTPENNVCLSFNFERSFPQKGIAILTEDLNGPECVVYNEFGRIQGLEVMGGTRYYFIIGSSFGCLDFELNIAETEACFVKPSLNNALCNPINSCVNTMFDLTIDRIMFEDVPQVDFEIIEDLNSGCWAQSITPSDPMNSNFFWFSFKANSDGEIAVIFNAALDVDVDFNVWGPFTESQMCNEKDSTISYMKRNQPIRSSWNEEFGKTGLTRENPITGAPVFDVFDCDFPETGADGDGFVRPIKANEGEYYVFLINEYTRNINSNLILVDWSETDGDIIMDNEMFVNINVDTSICETDTLYLDFLDLSNSVRIIPSEGVSCQNCLDPYIVPTVDLKSYLITGGGVCGMDSIFLDLEVLRELDTVDFEICFGDTLNLDVSTFNDNSDYRWLGDTLSLSCTDCPEPFFVGSMAGVYLLSYTQSLENCEVTNVIRITVSDQLGAEYNIISDSIVCFGSQLILSENIDASLDYSWSFNGIEFSTEMNPSITAENSGYYVLKVSNGLCPFDRMDSVFIRVLEFPEISLIDDLTVCEGDTVSLSNGMSELDVIYSWQSNSANGVEDPSSYNGIFVAETNSILTLSASRDKCTVEETVEIDVTPARVLILPDQDTIELCLGDSLNLSLSSRPSDVETRWINLLSGDTIIDNEFSSRPRQSFFLLAELDNENCYASDIIYVRLDSLPDDLSISPSDTTICEGETVVLISPDFNSARYDMEYLWTPNMFQQSGDSLYNLVTTPAETITYQRVSTSGACSDTALAIVNVNKYPEVTIIASQDTVCSGEEIQLFATVNPPNSDLEWTMGQNMSCDDCLNPTIRPTSSGLYTLEADNNGCPGSGSINITIQDLRPDFNPPSDLTVCEGEALALNQNPNANYNYTWDSDGESFTGQNERNPIVSPGIGSTRYFVTVTDTTTPEACGAREVSFNVLVPVADDNLEDVMYCDANRTFEFEATLLNADNSDLRDQDVSWSTGETGIILQVTPGEIVGNELSYTINLDGCISTASVRLVPNSLEIRELEDIGYCDPNEEFTITADILNVSDVPEESIVWSPTGDIGSSVTVSPSQIPGGQLSFTVNYDSCVGSGSMVFFPLNFNATIEHSIPNGDTILQGTSTQHNLTIDLDPNDEIESIIWENRTTDRIVQDGLNSYSHTHNNSGQQFFRVTIQTREGCSRVFEWGYFVVGIDIPNAFSPNNDGTNDFFNIITSLSADRFEIEEFKVFSRWGTLVYDNETPLMGWDGTNNDKDLPFDTYKYIVKVRFENSSVERQGEINLLR